MNYLVSLNLNQNEIQNVRLQNLAVAPANPVPGQLYFDTSLSKIRVWDATSWISLGAGTTATGFTPKGNWNAATNTPMLQDGVGTAGDIYRVNVGGATTLNGFNKWDAGDALFYDGANWVPIDNTIYVTAAELATGLALKTGRFASDVGDGTATAIVVTHNLNSRDVAVTLRRNVAPYDLVYADIEATSTNTVTLRFSVAPSAGQYRVVVVG